MINPGDSPEQDFTNKYMTPEGDGWRGILLARSPCGTEAIFRPLHGGAADVLVRETAPDRFPVVVGPAPAKLPPGWVRMGCVAHAADGSACLVDFPADQNPTGEPIRLLVRWSAPGARPLITPHTGPIPRGWTTYR